MAVGDLWFVSLRFVCFVWMLVMIVLVGWVLGGSGLGCYFELIIVLV